MMSNVQVEAGSLSLHPQAAQASRDVLHYTSKENNYASTISIRAIDPNRIRIVNEEGDVVMEEVEECKAFYQVKPL